MKSFIIFAVISMVSMASAGTILRESTLGVSPLTTSSLISPVLSSVPIHQTRILSSPISSGIIASPSWVGSPLLTRTVTPHGVWGSPWIGSPSLVAQPTLVHGGLIGGRIIW